MVKAHFRLLTGPTLTILVCMVHPLQLQCMIRMLSVIYILHMSDSVWKNGLSPFLLFDMSHINYIGMHDAPQDEKLQ